jgi:hypothetical protein
VKLSLDLYICTAYHNLQKGHKKKITAYDWLATPIHQYSGIWMVSQICDVQCFMFMGMYSLLDVVNFFVGAKIGGVGEACLIQFAR